MPLRSAQFWEQRQNLVGWCDGAWLAAIDKAVPIVPQSQMQQARADELAGGQAAALGSAFVWLMTRRSVNSEVCQAEWTRALASKKPVVLARPEPVEPPWPLRRRRVIDFGDFEAAVAQLVQHLTWLHSPK